MHSVQAYELDFGPYYAGSAVGELRVDSMTGDRTIQLPPDGILHYTRVDILEGKKLTFLPNANNTPVYILVDDLVFIDGTIDVSGKDNSGSTGGAGGPGGYDGGNGQIVLPDGISFPEQSFSLAGFGKGPGGGLPGYIPGMALEPVVGHGNYSGSYNRDAIFNGSMDGIIYSERQHLERTGSTYGTPLLMPLVGGSGSGGTFIPSEDSNLGLGGGGGGGAILIAAKNEIILFQGSILANGGFSKMKQDDQFESHEIYASTGSGGAIRLVAPYIGRGDRSLNDPYLNNYSNFDIELPPFNLNVHGGFWGRIRIDCLESNLPELVPSTEVTFSKGANMQVFPPAMPELRVERVYPSGNPEAMPYEPPIDPYTETMQPKTYLLPPQTKMIDIEIMVENYYFNSTLDVKVVITPERGEPYWSYVSFAAGMSYAIVTDVPVNPDESFRIDLWTESPMDPYY